MKCSRQVDCKTVVKYSGQIQWSNTVVKLLTSCLTTILTARFIACLTACLTTCFCFGRGRPRFDHAALTACLKSTPVPSESVTRIDSDPKPAPHPAVPPHRGRALPQKLTRITQRLGSVTRTDSDPAPGPHPAVPRLRTAEETDSDDTGSDDTETDSDRRGTASDRGRLTRMGRQRRPLSGGWRRRGGRWRPRRR